MTIMSGILAPSDHYVNGVKCKVDCYKNNNYQLHKSQIVESSREELANVTMGQLFHQIFLETTSHCNVQMTSLIDAFFINFKVVVTNQDILREVEFGVENKEGGPHWHKAKLNVT